ncbi:TetR/AcrR family transcriptional regulator [Nocardioides sp.]|uniref:TetR/AcrR family transcriptional regulator n=1 Tax=Nocardioides sp. TaxID=35761 RepID=UPI003D0AA575
MTATTPLPLSRDRILRCAVEVADRDGLDATSLRRVASVLGVHVTSLYNHVPTKEALLDGVVEELFAQADLPLGEVEWEQWVRRFVDATARMARAHPGASAVLLRRPVQGPGASATFEVGMAAFHRAGLDVRESYTAVKSVSLAILGCVVEQATLAEGAELSTDAARLPRADFPLFHEVVAADAEIDVVATLTEVLVAGLAQRLAPA